MTKEQLRQARLSLGLSLAKMAKALGMNNVGHLLAMEKGRRPVSKMAATCMTYYLALNQLAKKYDLPPTFLADILAGLAEEKSGQVSEYKFENNEK